ncbi:uncharacterized protein LOC106057950 isoform X2 [Biomphalaria glabrata]|uniref:Uncharacterized protein LOC106057950 isoform X2 n=1 Tax=Biomphalaria glabrata TaxID=6526 RepID=A0A9W3A0Y7_BIOGL|nr:uncharacterized protein LOC106057950 isoform X2 [Biomphalaria glabrata]
MDSSHLIVFSWQLIFVLITGLPSASLEYIPESSLVSIKRCSDYNHEMPGYFACKLDNCNHWITFQNCPDDQVSTGEMNLATRMMFCNSTAGPVYTSTIGLVEKKACQNFIEQGSIFRCQYADDECWFPFEVCDSGENKTKEMLNFNTKMCQFLLDKIITSTSCMNIEGNCERSFNPRTIMLFKLVNTTRPVEGKNPVK